MTRALRVCHVLHTIGHGGAQDLLLHLASARGTHISLQVVALTPTDGDDLADLLAERAVTVSSTEQRARADPRLLRDLLRQVRAGRPDVVHTHGKHADIMGGAAARALRVPSVSTLHLIEQEERAVSRAGVALTAAVRQSTARRVLTVSEAQRRWYLRSSPRADPARVLTVHNGVVDSPPLPPEQRRQVRASLGVTGDEVLVLALGMMRPDRGHQHLVTAASLLPSSGVVVALVGEGPQRARLQAQAAAASEGARVCFPGYRRDVEALLSAADVVVQPSLADAFPTSLLQALAAGCPVVASDVGGIAEIVTPQVGMLVPPASPKRLAAAILGLVVDAARRTAMGAAGRRRYEQHFTAEAWASRLREVYDGVTGEIRPTR